MQVPSKGSRMKKLPKDVDALGYTLVVTLHQRIGLPNTSSLPFRISAETEGAGVKYIIVVQPRSIVWNY